MSGKEMPGRAALSFPTVDGLLDMDQILETDPWNQINDFVQHNFMQNILDEFNDRIKLNPKLTPDEQGNTTTMKKGGASSSRKPCKSEAGRTSEEKPAKKRDGGVSVDEGQGSKKNEKKTGRKSKGGKQEGVDDEKIKKNKQKGDLKEKSKMIENALNTSASVNSASTDEKTGNVGEGVQIAGGEAEDATTNKNETIISTSTSINSRLPFDSSTPKRERTQVDNSEKKASGVSRLRKSPSSKKCRVKEIRASRDLNNNGNDVTAERKTNKKPVVKSRRETGKNPTTKKKRETENEEASRSNEQKDTLKRNKRNEKITAAGKRKIGKHEQRLIEKRRRRQEKQIRRHERKAERAMEKFGRHVTKIAQKMGYLPETCSNQSDDTDFSDESSYSSSHCCCCSTCSSYSTCSSCSCSCEYSEYTPCSSSSES